MVQKLGGSPDLRHFSFIFGFAFFWAWVDNAFFLSTLLSAEPATLPLTLADVHS